MNQVKLKNPSDWSKFTLGQAMFSDDGGKTWRPGRPPSVASATGMCVTKIDRKNGVITVGLPDKCYGPCCR
jgi:hypothetical protein